MTSQQSQGTPEVNPVVLNPVVNREVNLADEVAPDPELDALCEQEKRAYEAEVREYGTGYRHATHGKPQDTSWAQLSAHYVRGYEGGLRTLQSIERYKNRKPKGAIVTLPDGQQFLCPDDRAALETMEHRGGSIDPSTLFLRPWEVSELDGQYRWRPNVRSHWLEWTDNYADVERDRKSKDRIRERKSVLTVSDLRDERAEAPAEFLVQDILPLRGANVLVGDSGLGKTPLAIQFAVCVAAGLPFLGHATHQGEVLIADYENEGILIDRIDEVAQAVGVEDADSLPITTLRSPSQDEVFRQAEGKALVIVDSLRSFCAGKEKDADVVAPLLDRMAASGSCFLPIHHVRKTDRQNKPEPLHSCERVLEWLQEASGSRAIINQTFTRIGVDVGKSSDLVLRGYRKGFGEFGPFNLNRILNSEDDPIGYEVAKGVALLSAQHTEDYTQVQGKTLSFSEIVAVLRRSKDHVTRFVRACETAGVASSIGKAKSGKNQKKYVFVPAEGILHETVGF